MSADRIFPTRSIERTSKRVLVVDDNANAAIGLAAILIMIGHDVRVANDGESAITAAHAWLPEVVFLDIGLPGIDGYAVIASLKTEPRFDETVFVAVSGRCGPEDLRHAKEVGFEHYLAKPATIARVEEVLERSEARARETQPRDVRKDV